MRNGHRMRTELLYLHDSYATTMDAKLLEVEPEGTGTWRVLLDRTAFYPMGGGQPTDQGENNILILGRRSLSGYAKR